MDESLKDNWPESFGFSIYGTGPSWVVAVDRNSVAHQAGICPGDQLVLFDGHDVARMSSEAVKALARSSGSVSPGLSVVSRLQFIKLKADAVWAYGMSVRGMRPTLVDTVDPPGPAFRAGIKPEDILIEIDGHSIRTLKFAQGILREKHGSIVLAMVSVDSVADEAVKTDNSIFKARQLFLKINEAFSGDMEKKMTLVCLLKQYAGDRNIEALCKSLCLLLVQPRQKALVQELRTLIPSGHRVIYDRLINQNIVSDLPLLKEDAFKSSICSHWMRHLNKPTMRRLQRRDGSFGLLLRAQGPARVQSVLQGGAAERAGIQANDLIVSVNGIDVTSEMHDGVVRMLQGAGEEVVVGVVKPVEEGEEEKDMKNERKKEDDEESWIVPKDIRKQSIWNSDSGWSSESTLGLSRKGEEGDRLRELMEHVLTEKEKVKMKKALKEYRISSNLGILLDDLSDLLNTPSKRLLANLLLPLMPAMHQSPFKLFILHNTKQTSSYDGNTISSTLSSSSDDESGMSVRKTSVMRETSVQTTPAHLSQLINNDLFNYNRNKNNSNNNNNYNNDKYQSNNNVIYDSTSHNNNFRSNTANNYDIKYEDNLNERQNNCVAPENKARPLTMGFPREDGKQQILNEAMPNLQFNNTSHNNVENTFFGNSNTNINNSNNSDNSNSSKKNYKQDNNETNNNKNNTNNKNDDNNNSLYGVIKKKAIVKSPSLPPPPPSFLQPPPPPPPLPPPPIALSSNPGKWPAGAAGDGRRLRRIHWEKLEQVDAKSIWTKLNTNMEDFEDVIQDLQLEKQYSFRENPLGEALKSLKHSSSILSAKKAYNLSILLARVKLTAEEVQQRLLSFSGKQLSAQLLKQLIDFAPSDDEIKRYEDYRGLRSDLNEADRFCHQVSRIPGYVVRLQLLHLKETFRERSDDVRKDLELLLRAYQELLQSKSLEKVFEMLLAMGNFLNKGHTRVGDTSAFKINFLSQIDSTKSTTGNTNLLFSLANAVHTRHSNSVKLSSELPSIAQAAKVSLVAVTEELKVLERNLKDASEGTREMKAGKLNAGPSDCFYDAMQDFLKQGQLEVQQLDELHADVINRQLQVLTYFGVSSRDASMKEGMCSILAEFVSKFENALQTELALKTKKSTKQ